MIAENKQLQHDKGKVTKGSDASEKKVWITKLEINRANQSSSQDRGTLEWVMEEGDDMIIAYRLGTSCSRRDL